MDSNATGSVVSFVIIRCSRFPCARRRAAIFFCDFKLHSVLEIAVNGSLNAALLADCPPGLVDFTKSIY